MTFSLAMLFLRLSASARIWPGNLRCGRGKWKRVIRIGNNQVSYLELAGERSFPSIRLTLQPRLLKTSQCCFWVQLKSFFASPVFPSFTGADRGLLPWSRNSKPNSVLKVECSSCGPFQLDVEFPYEVIDHARGS